MGANRQTSKTDATDFVKLFILGQSVVNLRLMA